MAQTQNYHLFLTEDDTMSFLAWRNAMNGKNDSNMMKIDAALHDKADKSTAINLVLTSDGWSGHDQTLQVDGLTASDNAIAGMSQNATEAEIEAARDAALYVVGCGDGTLTVRALESVPSIAVPVCVIIFG